ncbi:hypothetical protein D3C85_1190140 [compost metagenome]
MRRQRFTALRTAENRPGQILFQRQPLRSVTDHDQFQIALWISVTQVFEAAFEQAKVLLRRESSYVNHRNVLLGQAPLLTQGIQPFARMKQLAVHTTRQQRQALEMPPFQFQALADARHQRHGRAIVKPAQIMREHPRQQTEPVLAGVLLKIGVKTADHRYPQTARRTQRRQPERAFRGDVQHVGTLALPAPQQFVHRRLTPLQPRISRQRPAPTQ